MPRGVRRSDPRAISRSTRLLDAWDRDTIRRLLPEADVAFTPFVDRDIFPSLARLRWIQSPPPASAACCIRSCWPAR